MPKAIKDSPTATNNWWCFTLNNYSEDDEVRIKGLMLEPKNKVVYVVYGKERGESGTPHLQGFIAFGVRKQRKLVCKLLGGHAFVEGARGTPHQASEYCKKDGDFWERGNLPEEKKRQGSRTDILRAKELIDDGGSTMDVAEEDFATYLKYQRALDVYARAVVAPRDYKTQMVIFEGDSGTYKSASAAMYHSTYPVVRPGHHQPAWFDGYNPEGHFTVLFDEFASWIPYNQLLELCDRYPARVQIKGGTVQYRAHVNVFTSNKSPEQWYENSLWEPLRRRIDLWFHHWRAEGASDAGGWQPGDLLVTVKVGRANHHPLAAFLQPTGQEFTYKLDEDAVRSTFDTQPDEIVMDAFWESAITHEPSLAQGSQASPLIVSSESEDELISSD